MNGNDRLASPVMHLLNVLTIAPNAPGKPFMTFVIDCVLFCSTPFALFSSAVASGVLAIDELEAALFGRVPPGLDVEAYAGVEMARVIAIAVAAVLVFMCAMMPPCPCLYSMTYYSTL